jgi:hypothetical protein
VLFLKIDKRNAIYYKDHIEQCQICPDSTVSRSKWGHCETEQEYDGNGCIARPCSNDSSNGSSIITAKFYLRIQKNRC